MERFKTALLAGWFAILSTGANYSTVGPFNSEKDCHDFVSTETAFCRHGTVVGFDQKTKQITACSYMTDEPRPEVAKDCWYNK